MALIRGWSELLLVDSYGVVIDMIHNADPDGFDNTRIFHPALSPDGTRIAFTCRSAGVEDICIIDSDGSNLEYLFPRDEHNRSSVRASHPSWSPDGSKIVFESDAQVCIVNSDGSGKECTNAGEGLGPFGVPEGHLPDWSPNGDKFAFVTAFDVYTMKPDGSNQHRLTSYRGEGQIPIREAAWSPDSRKIAFEAATGSGIGPICVMNADGTDQRCLTDGEAPEWSPDSKWIAYSLVFKVYVISSSGDSEPIFIADGYDPIWMPILR